MDEVLASLKKFTFGVRNLPVQPGFLKYVETKPTMVRGLERGIPGDEYMRVVNYTRSIRIRDALITIIEENDDDLLIIDDDLLITKDFDWTGKLNDFTYIAFYNGGGENDADIIMTNSTCFYLPRRNREAMLDTLRMYNNPKFAIDIWIDAYLPKEKVTRQTLFLDGTVHVFKSDRVLVLRVNKADGCFIIAGNDTHQIRALEKEGWYNCETAKEFILK